MTTKSNETIKLPETQCLKLRRRLGNAEVVSILVNPRNVPALIEALRQRHVHPREILEIAGHEPVIEMRNGRPVEVWSGGFHVSLHQTQHGTSHLKD